MKAQGASLSTLALVAATVILSAQQACSGRIIRVAHRYYLASDPFSKESTGQGRRIFLEIADQDHPDLPKYAGRTVQLAGERRDGSVTVATIEGVQPDAQLRQLFPRAAAFSTEGGSPPHFTIYGANPRTNPAAPPIGLAFWTTAVVPEERGYDGPIVMLVGMDMTGILTGVIVEYHFEPYGSFSVEQPRFAAQFKGKSIRDAFRVGADVDAVSRATMTVTSAARAIRDSSRTIARRFLRPEAVKR
jgi:hypothetical protein